MATPHRPAPVLPRDDASRHEDGRPGQGEEIPGGHLPEGTASRQPCDASRKLAAQEFSAEIAVFDYLDRLRKLALAVSTPELTEECARTIEKFSNRVAAVAETMAAEVRRAIGEGRR